MIALLLSLFVVEPTEPIRFFVSAQGSNQFDGRSEQIDTERKVGPFATPQRALQAVRALKQQHHGKLPGPVEILFLDACFQLTEPLIVSPADSGTEGSPLTIRGPKQGGTILTGGNDLGDWEKDSSADAARLRVFLPEVKAGLAYYRQLWLGERRMTRAKHPNTGELRFTGLPDHTPTDPYSKPTQRVEYAAGDLRKFANLTDVEIVALHYWVAPRLRLAELDEEKRIATFVGASRRRLTEARDFNRLAPYYIENAAEYLDAPGEWYLDRTTGVLTLIAPPGPIRNGTVGRLPLLLHLKGDPTKKEFVEYVHLEGLKLHHQDWWPDRKEPADLQAAVGVEAAVIADGTRHCRIVGCEVAHCSGYGLHLRCGCSANLIARCRFIDLGAGGIRIGETTQRRAVEERTHSNIVEDCTIADCGLLFHQAIGIWIGESWGNIVRHNEVRDLFYSGISVGWTWGYGPTLARENRIENNHLHHLGKGLLSDLGGIYTLGTQPGTLLRGNHIHDIDARIYGGWGIYFDEGSTGIVAENNLVYRTKHGGFHQHYGKDNIVRNNIFALGQSTQVHVNRVEMHRSFTFERNIVFGTTGTLTAGSWDEAKLDSNRNVWYLNGRPLQIGRLTWDAWLKTGRDTESLHADPAFVNPAANDFRLKPTSPVERVGFVPFDATKAGPRP